MRLAVLALLLSACGDPEPTSPPRDLATGPVREEVPESTSAFHVGVTLDGDEALVEAMMPRSRTVSVGSAEDATLRIPAELGIERRVVIEHGALRFGDEDRATVYRNDEAIDLHVVDPDARSPYPIRESMILYLGRVHVLVDPVLADGDDLGRVRLAWRERERE